MESFAEDATVIDEGNTYIGTSAIRDWLNRSSSEFTYTVEHTGAHKIDDTHYIATNHLEGDFPVVWSTSTTSSLSAVS
ncbi:hypothetical protein AB0H34_46035 [Saccharopolyspora shandongensis]|uniref:hypothetical protein n=1 Tax=Saccharopolyspora shandongensis TaxID=418495 RepID=UPI0033D2726B